MYFDKQKLIFDNKLNNTKYYIAGFKYRNGYSSAKNYIFYLNDILLEGKIYTGFFKKELAFSSYSLWKVHQEIGSGTYMFTQFLADLQELGNPKFCIIYAERPPRKIRKRTQREIDDDNAMMIAACSFNTAFL